jgi:hypothetical protein
MNPEETGQLLSEDKRSSAPEGAALRSDEEEENTEESEELFLGDGLESTDAVTVLEAAGTAADVSVAGIDHGPDLHSMGNLFLNQVGRYAFDATVILHLYVRAVVVVYVCVCMCMCVYVCVCMYMYVNV